MSQETLKHFFHFHFIEYFYKLNIQGSRQFIVPPEKSSFFKGHPPKCMSREFHAIIAIATPVVLPHLRCNGRKIRVCFFLKMSKHAQGWVLWFNWRKKSLPHLLIDLGWVIQFKERGWLLSETLPELALCTSFWLYSVFVIRGILSRQKRDAYLIHAMNIKGRIRITFFR